MKTLKSIFIALVFLSACFSAIAQEYKIGKLVINHTVARETPPGATVGAGYLTITNNSDEDDTLISASGSVSPIIQFHIMSVESNIMKMQELEGGLVVPAGGSVTFKPGGLHIMFMNLPQQLIEGEKHTVNLVFEKAGEVAVTFIVKKFESQDHGDHEEGHKEHKH